MHIHGNASLSWPNGLSGIWSGSPGPSGSWLFCVSEAHMRTPWLPGHLPSSLAVWLDALGWWLHVDTCALACCWCNYGEDRGDLTLDKCTGHSCLHMTSPLFPSYTSTIPSMFLSKPSCSLPSPAYGSSVKLPTISPVQPPNALPLCPITSVIFP